MNAFQIGTKILQQLRQVSDDMHVHAVAHARIHAVAHARIHVVAHARIHVVAHACADAHVHS